MALNRNKKIETVNLVDSDDEDAEEEIQFIGQGTKRKIIEVDLNEDLILGVVDGTVSAPEGRVKKLKENEEKPEEKEKGHQLVEYVVDDISPYHWTPDMRQFYNKVSKRKLKFSIKRIRKSMSTDQNLWKWAAPLHVYTGYTICFHCGGVGHAEKNCAKTKCYMCGTEGHKVRRCPKRKCLTCGKATPSAYVASCGKCLQFKSRHCTRCNLVGHSLIDCTDHWRRFHNVTALQRVEPPHGQVYKDSRNQWCSNCGRKGHVHEQCYATSDFNRFARTSTFVASYERAFPGDRAETFEEPRCDYVLSTVMDKVDLPKNRSREKFEPIKKTNRYFDLVKENTRPKNTGDQVGTNEETHCDYEISTVPDEVDVPISEAREISENVERVFKKKPRKLNGKQRRELKRAKKAEKRNNIESVQHFQNQPNTHTKKKNPRFQQPMQNRPDKKKKKIKANPTNTKIAINRWNNFLMGIN